MTATKPFYRVDRVRTVRDIIDRAAIKYADRPAFEIKRSTGEHFDISYRDYRADVNAMSNAFISKGIDRGAVAVIADNCYEYVLTYVSVICSGGVIAPIDKELDISDILSILETAEVKTLFVDRKALDRLGSENLSGFDVYSWRNDGLPEGVRPFEELLEAGREMSAEGNDLYKDVEHDPEKLCTLLFTSGTTGLSKGVMLCQRNFCFEVMAAMGVLKIYPEDCGISLLPFHHTFESSIIMFFAPYCGAKVTFCEGIKYVLRNMKEFNPTIFVAVPLVLETVHKRIMKAVEQKKNGEKLFKLGKFLCKAAGKVNIDLSDRFFSEIRDTFGGSMRMIICGGAAIDPQILEDFDAFGIKVIYGYGLTECAPLCIINNDRSNSTHSIGVPLPGVEVKVDEPNGDGVGEICVKGGMVMLGYYKNEEATAAVMDDEGFFHTGDLGFCDSKGFYHLTGRCKNMILTSNGENVYPEELEYHLDHDEFIKASMVESVQNARGETEIHAHIFPDFEEISEKKGRDLSEEETRALIAEIVKRINSHLPGFKHIRSFTVRNVDFVRTTAQKIKRDSNRK